MPYTKFKRAGKFCIRNKWTGKETCYKSAEAREKGMKMRAMFQHMPKSKIRVSRS